MQGLWRMPNNAPFDRAVEEYVKALSGCSAGAVIAVKDKMLAGGYEFSDKGFIPIPAYFARLCADERKAIADKVADLRRFDRRRAAIWNTLPDDWNNRQREEAIDRILAEADRA